MLELPRTALRESGDPVLRSLSVGLGFCNWRGPMLDRKTGVYWVPAFAGMRMWQ